MSFLLNLYPGDKFVFALANVLLQATVVIFTAWTLATFACRRNAAVRCNIWLTTLMLVLLSPITTHIVDAAGLVIFTISVPDNSRHESAIAVENGAFFGSREIADNRPVNFQKQATTAITGKPSLTADSVPGDAIPVAARSSPLSAVNQVDCLRAITVPILAVWGLGIVCLLVRLLHRGFAVRRLLQNTRSIEEHSGLRPVLSEIRRILGIDELPRVFLWLDEKLRITPFTAGIFRPAVVLPKNLLETLDGDELRDILVHEFAHILRRDPAVGLFERIAKIMFWPYPPVRLVSRNLARAGGGLRQLRVKTRRPPAIRANAF